MSVLLRSVEKATLELFGKDTVEVIDDAVHMFITADDFVAETVVVVHSPDGLGFGSVEIIFWFCDVNLNRMDLSGHEKSVLSAMREELDDQLDWNTLRFVSPEKDSIVAQTYYRLEISEGDLAQALVQSEASQFCRMFSRVYNEFVRLIPVIYGISAMEIKTADHLGMLVSPAEE